MPKNPRKQTRRRRSKAGQARTRGRSPRSPHRQVRANTTYLITKKCADDLFLILPSPLVNQILLYLLLLKAARYGIRIHGFCFLSNHFHLIITDVQGHLPAFMREFLGESSKAVQVATLGDRPIWSRKRYSAVELLDLDAAERKLGYALLNPTRAGLTDPADWPGITSAGLPFGTPMTATRPEVYFSSRRPATVVGVLEPLAPAYGGVAEESEQRIRDMLAAGVQDCHDELERRGETLLGREGVLKASRDDRGRRRVRHLNPRFATRNAALMKAAIDRFHQFEVDHEVAKQSYIAGHREVRFPDGTYGYRVVLGVRVVKRGEAA